MFTACLSGHADSDRSSDENIGKAFFNFLQTWGCLLSTEEQPAIPAQHAPDLALCRHFTELLVLFPAVKLMMPTQFVCDTHPTHTCAGTAPMCKYCIVTCLHAQVKGTPLQY